MPRGLIREVFWLLMMTWPRRRPFDERDQFQNTALAGAGVARQERQFAVVDLE